MSLSPDDAYEQGYDDCLEDCLMILRSLEGRVRGPIMREAIQILRKKLDKQYNGA